ncbi:MAG: hypothetical protein ABI690_11335 [Chloroflexota bacterium]
MSEQELYEIARRRIDKRNRRWIFWAVDLMVLIMLVAALVFLGDTGYATIGVAALLGWAGIFVLHTIAATMAESRDNDIQNEVAKLRDAVSVYEKPKRMELSEDGELVERDNWEVEEAAKSRLS